MQHARALGITGWVRNRWDGSVEVWAEGLDHLADDAGDFVTTPADDTQPLALPDNLRSAVLYGSAA